MDWKTNPSNSSFVVYVEKEEYIISLLETVEKYVISLI